MRIQCLMYYLLLQTSESPYPRYVNGLSPLDAVRWLNDILYLKSGNLENTRVSYLKQSDTGRFYTMETFFIIKSLKDLMKSAEENTDWLSLLIETNQGTSKSFVWITRIPMYAVLESLVTNSNIVNTWEL